MSKKVFEKSHRLFYGTSISFLNDKITPEDRDNTELIPPIAKGEGTM
jgi:hypothetical protein